LVQDNIKQPSFVSLRQNLVVVAITKFLALREFEWLALFCSLDPWVQVLLLLLPLLVSFLSFDRVERGPLAELVFFLRSLEHNFFVVQSNQNDPVESLVFLDVDIKQ
jgi:hypothetical protein